ncbi:MAG: SBBP repeat-containing protein, partial [bacterium]
MKNLLTKSFIAVMLLCSSFTSAQQLWQNWVLRYNGPANSGDFATALAVDQTQNVIVTGTSTNLAGTSDYLTIKYDGLCVYTQWIKPFSYNFASANDIKLDAAGNSYVTGSLFSTNNSSVFGTIKYNSVGTQLWIQYLSGEVPLASSGAFKMFVDAAGNSYVTGFTGQAGSPDLWDVMTVKYNTNGVMQWKRYFNGPGNGSDAAEGIFVDSQGNTYVVGSSEGSGTGFDYFLLRYSAGGTWTGNVRYNGEANGNDFAYSLDVDNLGNVFVTGVSREYEIPQDAPAAGQNTFTTVKYNSSFVQQWSVKYFGSASDATGKSVKALNSNEIYVTGYAKEFNAGKDFVTLKYSGSGRQLWKTRYNGPQNMDDIAVGLSLDNAGNAYVTGESNNGPFENTKDYATIKYNPSGVQLWAGRYDGPGYNEDVPSAINSPATNVIYVTGKSKGVNSGSDYATIRYSNQWLISCAPPIKKIDNLNDVCVINENTAFAVGNNGKVFSSNDKGLHWNTLNSGVNENLFKVKFINDKCGIVTGESFLLKTNDNGISWKKLEIPLAGIKDVFMLNEKVSFISGSNGTILRSDDFWDSYTIQNTNLTESIVNVFFSNNLKGKCISESGVVNETFDGGLTWNNSSSVDIAKLNNAFFKTSDIMVAAGDGGKIMFTSTGGATWLNRGIDKNINVRSVYLDDKNNLFASGENGQILFSSDYGTSWVQQPTNSTSKINDLSFFDSNCGIAVCDDGQIFLTSLGTIETDNNNILASDNSNFENDNNNQLIPDFELYQNYPNPFNPNTLIKFSIPENSLV